VTLEQGSQGLSTQVMFTWEARQDRAASYFFRAYLNTAAVGLPELVHASSW